MGVFDLRCGVSRISTMWRPERPGRVTFSMFLVEELAGAWVPWTPPIRGTYDRYGGIELWPEDISDYTTWAGERLWSLWDSGDLITGWPDDLADERRPDGTLIEQFLHHGAETAYNGITVTIDGRPAAACIVHDLVADALAAADPAPQRTLADALAGWFPEGGAGRRHFSDPPPSALPQLARYASVWAYARAHRGLAPIRSEDAGQHDDDDVRRSLAEARARDDVPLRRLLAADDPAEDAAARAYAAAVARGVSRPYSPRERFIVGDLLDHPKFGLGLVETELDAGKLRVRFAGDTRVLVHRRA